jgi:integrase
MPAINAAFDALEVRAPKSWQGLELPAVQSSSLKRGEPTHANLGHESRDTSRWRTLLRAARETVSELSITSIQVDPAVAADLRFNNPRLPLKIIWARMPTWSREQFSALVKTLTTTGQGMPATLGHLRMMVLGHLVDGCWRETGKTVKLHRRSFKGFLRDEPRATAAAAGARERLSKWRLTFDSISAAAPVGKVSAADAGALLVADLIIHARVADSEVLQDACRGKVRVVCRGQAHFLEWSSDDELPANGHGVLRHRISAFAATMVGVVQSTTVLRHSSLSYVSKRLHPLLKAMSLAAPASVADIVRIALPTIDALNCMELPGNVAAARAGRFRTASRSWPDWTRTQDGSFIGITGSEEKGDGDESVLDRAPATPLLYFSESPPQSRTQGRAFTKEIRAILGWHRIGGVDAKVDPSMRRSMARAVEVTCRKFEPLVSPALHCLGLWCHSLFERDHGQDKIRVSTIRRYFSALTAPFESLAHDLDLRELDEEEVTALFQEVLDCRNLAKPSYVRARLREFDRHCAKAFGTQSPDWSELAVEDTGIGISPGHLDEAAYLRLFSQLASAADANLARQSRLMALLGYRFGLRCAEAALLRVKDVVRYGKAVHVVVERLKRRDTKSNRGRRTVPLLFVLSEDEQQLLDDVMLQAKKRQEVDKAALLLSDPANPAAIINAAAIAKAVATEMKQSTGNVRLSEHHLRHSFACAIWQALEVPLDQLPDEISREGSRRIRTLLLAEERIGRRAPWALASVLGHSHPSNAYRSYVHFLCERADHLLSAGLGATPPIGSWAKMVDLDKAERQVPPPRSIVAGTASLVAPNMQVIVLCLQLLAASDSTPNIAASLKVAPDWLSRLERVYRSVSLRVASEASEDKTKRYGKLAQKGLLGHILRTGLPRIVTALEGLERLVEKSARAMTTPEDEYFIGMMGYRRQISFWTETQMIFLRRALEDLGLERGRLNLLCPSKLSSKVTTIAQSSGWIETSTNRPMSATESKPRTFPLIPTIGSRQEPTKFGDPEYTVTDRLSLELSIREGVGIGNRLEFIFALVCIWAWSVARSPAPTANSVSK